MRNHLSKQLIALSSLALVALVVTGAGCTSTTNTNVANVNTTTVPVENTNVEPIYADTNENVNTDGDMVTTEATISIVSPEDGDVVESDMPLEVSIKNFNLAPEDVEGDNAEGEGHYHVWVDGEYFAQAAGSKTKVKDLPLGEHEVMVSLQNNDHSDLEEPITSETITVTVE